MWMASRVVNSAVVVDHAINIRIINLILWEVVREDIEIYWSAADMLQYLEEISTN
jgi:hypothetical protein